MTTSKIKQVVIATARFHLCNPIQTKYRYGLQESKSTIIENKLTQCSFDPEVGARLLIDGSIMFIPISNIAAVEYFDQTYTE
jgi:hypothetical protein